MIISDLIGHLDFRECRGDTTRRVDAVCYSSGACGMDSLFVAIKGLQADGHDYIDDACRRGAVCVVHEREVVETPGVTFVRVDDSRRALARLGSAFYGEPSREVFLVGVTGTNGKTTVCHLVESCLQTAGRQTGTMGTINYRYGETILPAPTTTPESLDLQKMLRSMADAEVTHVVMEVSSHALDLKRVHECAFNVAIFTNLSEEHLDYHQTMEDYYIAKKRFFTDIVAGKTSIINADDPWGQRLIAELPGPVRTFSLTGNADVRVLSSVLSMTGIEAVIETKSGRYDIRSPLIGRYNLSNILAAVATAEEIGLDCATIDRGINSVASVAGRLERVGNSDDPWIFVDYAHTEDALKNVLENLRRFEHKRLITVFGCGGDRDTLKRPRMGWVATELSDIAIVTSDNPRTEEPLAIIAAIRGGIDVARIAEISPERIAEGVTKKSYTIIPDRRRAIETAVLMADLDDIVVIAGKGHEVYQIVGTTKHPFDDRDIARKALLTRKRKVHGARGH